MVLFSLLALLACKEDEEIIYTQFNALDDIVDIEVGVAEELPSTTVDLHSSTGQIIVGSATVDPSGGPIGTTHVLTVIVSDEWEDQVPRVTVRTDSGSRGEDEYELTTDSADEGLHQIKLVSYGDEGEVRTDSFTIRLWEVEGLPIEVYDTSLPEEEEGSE